MSRQIEAILADFATSHWLKKALETALERDPVDALADAEALVNALRERLENLQGSYSDA